MMLDNNGDIVLRVGDSSPQYGPLKLLCQFLPCHAIPCHAMPCHAMMPEKSNSSLSHTPSTRHATIPSSIDHLLNIPPQMNVFNMAFFFRKNGFQCFSMLMRTTTNIVNGDDIKRRSPHVQVEGRAYPQLSVLSVSQYQSSPSCMPSLPPVGENYIGESLHRAFE